MLRRPRTGLMVDIHLRVASASLVVVVGQSDMLLILVAVAGVATLLLSIRKMDSNLIRDSIQTTDQTDLIISDPVARLHPSRCSLPEISTAELSLHALSPPRTAHSDQVVLLVLVSDNFRPAFSLRVRESDELWRGSWLR